MTKGDAIYFDPHDEPPHPEVRFDTWQPIVPGLVEGKIDTKVRRVIIDRPNENGAIGLTAEQARELKIWLDYAWSMLRAVTQLPGGKTLSDEEVQRRVAAWD